MALTPACSLAPQRRAQRPPLRGRPNDQFAATDQQFQQQFDGAQFLAGLARRLDVTEGQLKS